LTRRFAHTAAGIRSTCTRLRETQVQARCSSLGPGAGRRDGCTLSSSTKLPTVTGWSGTVEQRFPATPGAKKTWKPPAAAHKHSATMAQLPHCSNLEGERTSSMAVENGEGKVEQKDMQY